jgi:predicted transcriptional regulator
MDPVRRNLLYYMKGTSTVQEKQAMVYTKMNRTKLARRFKILRKKTKPAAVETSEAELSKTKSSSVDIEEYEEYVKKRALEEKVLSSYYGNETISTNQSNFFPNQFFTFNIKNKADLYFGQLFITIREYFPPTKPT